MVLVNVNKQAVSESTVNFFGIKPDQDLSLSLTMCCECLNMTISLIIQ